MLLKLTLKIFIVALAANICASDFCSDCEEEIWEEVPCDEITPPVLVTTLPPPIVSITTTTTTTPAPIIPTTTSAPPPIITPAPPLPPIGAPDIFKRCFCECKVGCRDFCRKVAINNDNSKKTVLAVTKIPQYQPNSLAQLSLLQQQQQQFIPSAYGTSYTNSPVPNSYPLPLPNTILNTGAIQQIKSYPLESSAECGNAYEQARPGILNPPPAPVIPTYGNTNVASYYPNAVVDSTSYSVDELTRLLRLDGFANTDYEITSPVDYLQNYISSSSYGQAANLLPQLVNAPPPPPAQYAAVYGSPPAESPPVPNSAIPYALKLKTQQYAPALSSAPTPKSAPLPLQLPTLQNLNPTAAKPEPSIPNNYNYKPQDVPTGGTQTDYGRKLQKYQKQTKIYRPQPPAYPQSK